MCGIAGKVDFSGAVVPELTIQAMCARLVHRGPDAYGSHCEPFVGLGQRRLSVIDLNDTANPPLSNEAKSSWIVFNGEIYNYREEKVRLVAQGHRFRTGSDTEVLLHLYDEQGLSCLEKLRGMFAFAVWDGRNKRLIAARDRLGKKPFYYCKTPSSLIFASSLNAILADPGVGRTPNFHAIDSYLHYQYIPSPETAFEGIFKLPAAHYLICDATGEVKVERYWSPDPVAVSNLPEAEIETEIVRMLRESVRLRLISDVPVGVFLSGGIDSGVVTALMALESSAPVKTFSIGFDESDFNELPYARKVAEKYGTEHHEFFVRPSASEVLPLLVKHFGEPFGDSSAIPSYYVSHLARQHVTVALSGDGGDESFLGYDHYGAAHSWSKVDFIPYAVRRSIGMLVSGVAAQLPFSNSTTRIERAGKLLGSRLSERYDIGIAMLKDEEKRASYTPQLIRLLAAQKNGHPDWVWPEAATAWDAMSTHDKLHYLPDCLMVKTDVAAMVSSLEVRCPFLDHQFVEFAASIPARFKRNGNGGKVILRRSVRDLLPAEILIKRKTGFGVPLQKWFRNDLKSFVSGLLLDETSAKRGLFEPSFLHRIIEDQVSGKRDWSNRLWGFLCLELWFREFID